MLPKQLLLVVLSDNTPTLAWCLKGSTTTYKAAAYLLRVLALHQHHYQYLRRDFFIPGVSNCMADDCSPSAVENVPTAVRDALCADLLLSAMQASSTAGNISHANARNSVWQVWHDFCVDLNLQDLLVTMLTRSLSCKSLPVVTGMAALPCMATLYYRIALLKKSFVPCDIRLSNWGTRTLA
eukprot:scaffold23476_cov53-Attheya_sp.AAC.10